MGMVGTKTWLPGIRAAVSTAATARASIMPRVLGLGLVLRLKRTGGCLRSAHIGIRPGSGWKTVGDQLIIEACIALEIGLDGHAGCIWAGYCGLGLADSLMKFIVMLEVLAAWPRSHKARRHIHTHAIKHAGSWSRQGQRSDGVEDHSFIAYARSCVSGDRAFFRTVRPSRPPSRSSLEAMARERVNPHILDLFETLTGPHRVRRVHRV